MKKNDLKKIGISILILTISTGSIAPTIVRANEIMYIQEDNLEIQVDSDLQSILALEGVTEQELIDYSNYIKQTAAEQSFERSRLKALKKGIEFAIRNANIIPSKTVRDAINQYGTQISKYIDYADEFTTVAIRNELVSLKVPYNVAQLIADFIVTYLL